MIKLNNILNILNLLNNDNIVYYMIIFMVILISLAVIYIIFNELKQMKKKLTNQNKSNQENKESLPLSENPNPKKSLNIFSEKPDLIQLTDIIPSENPVSTMETTKNDKEELQSITKELESLPKERKINLTPFEEEQEQKAIISYEELLSKTNNVSINYSDTNCDPENDVLIKKVDLATTGQIELDPIKKAFLEALKQLNDLLN